MAFIMYYIIDENDIVIGRHRHIKNKFIAVVVFLRIGSCESSSLSSKITYKSFK
jgi:hypothetical protein